MIQLNSQETTEIAEQNNGTPSHPLNREDGKKDRGALDA